MKIWRSILLVGFLSGQLVYADSQDRAIVLKVTPEYPALARKYNISGSVKLRITISPKGTVTKAEPMGGSPLLLGSAQTAVLKWKYAPSAAETTSIVSITFDGSK